jgi:hypothetical protein
MEAALWTCSRELTSHALLDYALFGTEGLRLLEQGATAVEVVSAVTADDVGRDHRQGHVMDSQGCVAARAQACARCLERPASEFVARFIGSHSVLPTRRSLHARGHG